MNRTMQVGLAAIGLALVLAVVKSFKADEEPFSQRLARDAERLNATLPEMVSKGIRLDRAEAGPGNVFSYFYTVLDDASAKGLSDQAGTLELKVQLKERVCLSMPDYRDHGVVVKYWLRSVDGRTIANVFVDPSACDS